MTLSRFLRDYLYIALGGNRKGELSRYRNLMLTMLIGGIWHGAGWNFLIWGGLHGLYLIIYHTYSKLIRNNVLSYIKITAPFAWSITFISVVVSWVFFRAPTFDDALSILFAMIGGNGINLPQGIYSRIPEDLKIVLNGVGIVANSSGTMEFIKMWLWNSALLLAVLIMPNTQDIFSQEKGSLSQNCYERNSTFWPFYSLFSYLHWKRNKFWALLVGLAFATAFLTLSQVSEFLYFQF